MYRIIIRYGIASAVLTSLFSYGLLVGVYQIFPYSQILAFKQFFMPNPVSVGRNKEYRIELFEKFSPSAEVVFVGDSITEGGEWAEFFPNLKVANRGVGSDKTSDVLKRIDSIISVTPNTAFIMLGINDILNEIAIDEIVYNYGSVISSLKVKGTSVFVQSTIQCQVSRCGQKSVSKVNLLNEKLLVLADEYDVPFVYLADLSNTEGLDVGYTYDGIHLSAKGYMYWVKQIEPLLE